MFSLLTLDGNISGGVQASSLKVQTLVGLTFYSIYESTVGFSSLQGSTVRPLVLKKGLEEKLARFIYFSCIG